MSNINYEIIERYLAGELEGEELEAFEKELQHNEELKNELSLYNTIEKDFVFNHKIKEDKAALITKLDGLNKQHFNNQPAKVISIKKRWLYAAASIAAALALVFILLPKTQLSNQELFAENINKNIEPLSLTQRGNNDSLLTKASALYNNKNYENAIPILIKPIQIDSTNFELQMALAFSYLQTNRSNSALIIFNKISAGNTVYADKAKWYTALLYLKNNQKKECIDILKQISNTYDNYSNVINLLKILEK